MPACSYIFTGSSTHKITRYLVMAMPQKNTSYFFKGMNQQLQKIYKNGF